MSGKNPVEMCQLKYQEALEPVDPQLLSMEGASEGSANGPDHEEGSGSDFTIVDAPSSESNGSTVAENEITESMSDVHVSDTGGARRKDEYDVDFE